MQISAGASAIDAPALPYQCGAPWFWLPLLEEFEPEPDRLVEFERLWLRLERWWALERPALEDPLAEDPPLDPLP